MKKIIVIMACMNALVAGAQQKKYDSLAILIIDRMADVIGDLESCSFNLSTAVDVRDSLNRLVKTFGEYEVYLSGPDKMLVNAHGFRGHRQYMYNGQQLAYYSFNEHNYGIIPAPGTIIHTIDSLNKHYDIEFPAGDFIYPTFTDDLIAHSDSILYLGIQTINGRECFQVMAFSKEATFQIFISNDAYNLPATFVITYTGLTGNPQYAASFSNWQVNPTLPAAMFNFVPPPNSARVRILSKTDK